MKSQLWSVLHGSASCVVQWGTGSPLSAMKRTDKASSAAGRWCIFRLEEWANEVFTLCLFLFSQLAFSCFTPLPTGRDSEAEGVFTQKNNDFACTFHFFLCRNFLDYIRFVWFCWGGVGHAEGLWKEACSTSTSMKVVNKMHNRNKSSDHFFFWQAVPFFYFVLFFVYLMTCNHSSKLWNDCNKHCNICMLYTSRRCRV